MKRKYFLAALCVVLSAAYSIAQSKTTQALDEKFEGLSLFFYKNTLRMLNQKDDPDFDALIKNIEKMKFVMVDKGSAKFGGQEYKELIRDYEREAFEPIMTSRSQGRNFDIYLKDKSNAPLGTVVIVNDSTSLFVLDIVGTIDVSKASALFSALDDNTDVGKRIKNFVRGKEKETKEEN